MNRRPAAIGLVATALLAATACGYGRTPLDPVPHKDPATLQAYLDRIPLPPGSRLLDEHVETGKGDAETAVTRTYRTTSTRPACAQLIDAAHGWTVREDSSSPADTATCDPTGSPDASGNPPGRLGEIRPDDATLGAVSLTWTHDQLIFDLTEGNLPSK